MTPANETITALLAVLAEERTAIRTLDTKGIVKAADEKQELAVRVCSMSPEQVTLAAAELASLRGELRRNGILLAHARACVARAIDVISPRESSGLRGRLRARV